MNEPFLDLQKLNKDTCEYVLEYSGGGHNKFYEIYSIPTNGNKFHVVCRYGRIGTSGVAVARGKDMHAVTASILVKKLKEEKINKGYVVKTNGKLNIMPTESKKSLTRINLIEF